MNVMENNISKLNNHLDEQVEEIGKKIESVIGRQDELEMQAKLKEE